MTAELLSGKTLAAELQESIRADCEDLLTKSIHPKLAVVMATDDGGTKAYVRHIAQIGKEVGVKVDITDLKPDSSQLVITKKLIALANDSDVHGIILQVPLPDGVNAEELRQLIPVDKDVDGANPTSFGRIASGMQSFAPSTAVAVMEMLRRYDIPTEGTHAVIIGRSLVVGKPLSQLLLEANATVTICHSKSRNLQTITQTADVLVVAIGKPRFVNADFIKPGAIVVDVGTTASDGGLVGDVDHKSMQDKAGAFSPVPGGVGPVTTAILLKQTVLAAKNT